MQKIKDRLIEFREKLNSFDISDKELFQIADFLKEIDLSILDGECYQLFSEVLDILIISLEKEKKSLLERMNVVQKKIKAARSYSGNQQ
ncbi:MAG: hypothetical protein ABGX12_01955 [Desulfurobacteriaceae bacterium]